MERCNIPHSELTVNAESRYECGCILGRLYRFCFCREAARPSVTGGFFLCVSIQFLRLDIGQKVMNEVLSFVKTRFFRPTSGQTITGSPAPGVQFILLFRLLSPGPALSAHSRSHYLLSALPTATFLRSLRKTCITCRVSFPPRPSLCVTLCGVHIYPLSLPTRSTLLWTVRLTRMHSTLNY